MFKEDRRKDKSFTEPPFSGKLLHEKGKGDYRCAVCGQVLFSSEAKYDSGTGWPSFDQALPGAVSHVPDNSHGMNRTEVICSRCGNHLGHLFDDLPDGTLPIDGSRTGKRYCLNSVCLNFKPGKD